jgi:[NiFe] hydrogenase diaphorase moiety large subunit
MNLPVAQQALAHFGADRGRLLDMALYIQERENYVSPASVHALAVGLNISHADVERTVSFYHFLSLAPLAKFTIYLNNSVVAVMHGYQAVHDEFEKEIGIRFGQVDENKLFGLYTTPCIGMSDQEPAALINGHVFTELTPFRVREIVRHLKAGKAIEDLFVKTYGEGKNASPLLRTAVRNNIKRMGPILNPQFEVGQVLRQNLSRLSPEQVLFEIRASELRGRGGAGFPTGLKWHFCRMAEGEKKYVFCNADEGEPGTFKDRVILTETPHTVFEGMIIAGYAIGSDEGILYLRYEYKYMREYLEDVLQNMRRENLLGENICGIKGFNFDIRIQSGAGSYVCGEESALIESAEGKRGEPRPRPPFPVEKGYNECPTIVNNVETLCSAVNILYHGHDWYLNLGTENSKGTKVLSISGDCRYPGIYELEWGFTVNEILEMVGAADVQAVQMGGPSGSLIGPDQFDHQVCYEDLATGGCFIIFNTSRNLLRDVVLNFMEFFVHESCGSCVPCRNIPYLLKQKLEKMLDGRGTKQDIKDMKEWSKIMKFNRCGLGHTAANPVVSVLNNFRHLLEAHVNTKRDFISAFNIADAVAEANTFVKRENTLMH